MHPYTHHLAQVITTEHAAVAADHARRWHLTHRPRPRSQRPVFRPRPPGRAQLSERSIHLGTAGASN